MYPISKFVYGGWAKRVDLVQNSEVRTYGRLKNCDRVRRGNGNRVRSLDLECAKEGIAIAEAMVDASKIEVVICVGGFLAGKVKSESGGLTGYAIGREESARRNKPLSESGESQIGNSIGGKGLLCCGINDWRKGV